MQPSQGMGGASGGPAGGMNAASLQEIQRLQQQMQYQRQTGGSHPTASVGGMSSQHHMQSQPYSQNPQYPAMQASQQGRGAQMGNTALAMMQHPSNTGSGPNPMTGGSSSNAASIYGNWTGLQTQQNPSLTQGSSMDASSGSSARLMAMASGMRMSLGGNSGSAKMGGMMDQSSTMQNMQVLLQQQQQQAAQKGQMPLGYTTQGQQAQQSSMMNKAIAGGASGMMLDTTGGGATGTSQHLLLQQQLASLSKQGVATAAALQNATATGNPLMSTHGSNILQAQQQQLLQQMQQRGTVNPAMLQQMTSSFQQQDPSSVNTMGGMVSGMAQHRTSLTGPGGQYGMGQQNQPLMNRGSLNEQQLRIHQQNLLRQTSTGHHSVHSDSQESHKKSKTSSQMPSAQNDQGMRSQSQGHGSMHGMQDEQGHGSMSGMQQQEDQDSMSGMQQRYSSGMRSVDRQTSGSVEESAMDRSQHSAGSSSHPTPNPMSSDQAHGPFLDGSFAGGWQSNDDLPDRRRVIFSILEVIRQMRPDTSKMSNKLPHMAKSLEEHLYRSAATKEEYLDFDTLKTRLQSIAQGLEIHRTTDMVQGDPFFGLMQSQQQPYSQGFSYHQQNVPNFAHTDVTNQQQNASWDQSEQMSAQSGSMSGMNQSNMSHRGSQIHRSSSEDGSFPHQEQQVPQHDSVHNGSHASTSMSHQRNTTWGSHGSGSGSGASANVPDVMGQTNMAAHRSMNSMSTQRTSHQGHGNNFGALQQDRLSSGGQQQNASNWGPEGSSPIPAGSMMGNDMGPPSQTGGTGGTINPDYPNTPKYQDPAAPSKPKVIAQQQQRLLLLRHASKCKAGDSCETRFCQQMVTLWKHMKTCRDKNCKTSHCLSSRCVLNHYRICKQQGKTATCEVCGPVMAKIRQREKEDESGDPLASNSQHSATDSQLTAMSSEMLPQSAATGMPSHRSDVSTSMGSYQRGQSDSMTQHQNQAEQAQIQQIQAQQLKLQGQLDALKQLQKQQEQLLEQQSRLQEESQHVKDPSSQQAQQLHQQQMLLHQLQQRCQQEQLLLQQEIQVQSKSAGISQSQEFQGARQMSADLAPSQTPIDQSLDPNVPTDHSTETKKKQRKSSANEGKGRRGGKGKQIKGKRLRVEGFSSTESASSAAKQAEVSSKKRTAIASTPKERSQKKSKTSQKVSAKPVASSAKEDSASEKSVAKENTSLIPYMTKKSIQRHLESLNKRIRLSSRTVSHKCLPVVQELIDDQFGWVFHDAVDPIALGLPDYFDVVKHPMHLELVKKKLENAIYSDMEGFARDLKLVFENAILYNGESSEVGELAQRMLDKFENLYASVVQDIESSHVHLESKGVLCSLCGTHKRKFEPSILYCQGKCGMQRIQRHSTYYTDRTKASHWCEACYSALHPDEPISLEDGTKIKKKDLQEFKNDALPEEAWVNCDDCGSWVHQVCALFNGRTNKSNAKYSCPNCHLKKSDAERPAATTGKFMKGAEHLAHCSMSRAIEKGLEDALQTAYKARAEELGVSIEEVEKVGELAVRVVSNVEKKHFVGEEMVKRYTLEADQSEFPVRSKCIALFQKIHGVDTLLFALYVYEYGQECPPPNKRRVYVSYLDSVKYFEPKCYRTAAYQAVLVEYLRYVKERGFHTAHIWSCPPTPGDDYIFYCHPSHQRIPREDMLRAWYHQMLDKAKALGIVIRTTTLYDEYFTNDTVDQVPGPRTEPTCLPYFEGDYIPGEIENIIKQLKKHGMEQSGKDDGLPDDVMRRIGHNLGKMKDNFIVVHLRNRRFAAAVERGDDVSEWMEDSDEELVRSKRAKISGKDSSILLPASKQEDTAVKVKVSTGKLATRPMKSLETPQAKNVSTGLSKSSTSDSLEITVVSKGFNDASRGRLTQNASELKPSVVESTDEQKPSVVESKDEQKPAVVESTEEQKPAVVESTEELKPVAESTDEPRPVGAENSDEPKSVAETMDGPKPVVERTDELKSAAEDSDKSKPVVETTDEPKPVVENKDEPKSIAKTTDELKPVVGNMDEQKSLAENADKQKPVAESTDKPKLVLENADEQQPEAKPTEQSKPAAENSEGQEPAGQNSDEAKPVEEDVSKENLVGENVAKQKPAAENAGEQEPVAESTDDQKLNQSTSDDDNGEEGKTPPEIDPVKQNSSTLESHGAVDSNREERSTVASQEEQRLTAYDGITKGKDAEEVCEPSAEEEKVGGDLSSSVETKVTTETKKELTEGGEMPGGRTAAQPESGIKTSSADGAEVSEAGGTVAQMDTNTSSQKIADSDEKDTVPTSSAVDDIASTVSRHVSGLKRPSKTVADTADDDAPVENELFESRQLFLNYCQTNHCQFDELRRAKHSTMMVLFQLHNPLAPKFLQQCCACYRDITHGIRYHCNICSNFDLCQECYQPVTTGLWAQRDPRFAHDKSHTFTPFDMECAEETQKGRVERQKALKAHIELLEHAGTCQGAPKCSLQNCSRMKKLFEHVRSCDVKPKNDCRICTRLLTLCAMHARKCGCRGDCPVPFCDRIRERNKRLQKQQQLMDDRRRQAQNELYHAGGEAS